MFASTFVCEYTSGKLDVNILFTKFFPRPFIWGNAMFSSWRRYALRALAYLGGQAPAARTTEQIAQATGLPLATLAKILQVLSHEGIVNTQRGIGGGVELARPPSQVTVKEVVDAFAGAPCSEIFAIGACCGRLHRRLRIVGALADRVLQETTLAELVADDFADCDSSPAIDAILEELASAIGVGHRDEAPSREPP